MKITFLGPYGATFSHDAYNALAEVFGAPRVTPESYVPAATNGDVLKIVLTHGGYGAIAMETLAGCRIDESLGSFADLLLQYKSPEECPVHIVGAVALKLHFCLMSRVSSLYEVTKVIGHEKSFGACKKSVAALKVPTDRSVSSNGEAARLASLDTTGAAALGPRSAAEKYGLHILADAFEDEEAITTFFLIAPRSHVVATGEHNRVLLTFKVPHKAGAVVKVQIPFAREFINMINLHSLPIGKREYQFLIEAEVEGIQVEAMECVMSAVRKHVTEYLYFGPFQVLSR